MQFKQLLDDYRAGIIGDLQLNRMLDWQERSQTYNQNRRDKRVITKLSDYTTATKSPEDIIIEREDALLLLSLISTLKKEVRDFNIFWMHDIEGRTQEYIANRIGVSQSQVSRRYAKALNNISYYADKIKGSLMHNDFRELLLPRASKKEAGSAKVKIRYPSEFLSKLNIGGRMGKRVWINHTRCVNDQYFDNAFGDTKTCCAYCEKCTNKTMRKRSTHA